jgi:hypothetical protein
VKTADRDRRRRLGKGLFGRLRAAMGKAAGPILKLVVLAVLLGGIGLGVFVWRQNARVLGQSEERIVEALNPALRQASLEPISSIDFTNASDWRPAPTALQFEAPVFQTTQREPQQAGTLTGSFNRTTGGLKVDLDLASGVDQPTILLQTKPVR